MSAHTHRDKERRGVELCALCALLKERQERALCLGVWTCIAHATPQSTVVAASIV